MRHALVLGLGLAMMLAGTVAPADAQDAEDFADRVLEEARRGAEKRSRERLEARRKDRLRHPWAVSSDGSRVMAATHEGRIEVWTVPNPEPDLVLDGHPKALVDDLEFDAAGTELTSVGGDGLVRFWDAKSGERLDEWGESSANTDYRYRGIEYAPDGRHSVYLRGISTDVHDDAANEWLEPTLLESVYAVDFLADSDRFVASTVRGVLLIDVTLAPRPFSDGDGSKFAAPVWELRAKRPGFGSFRRTTETLELRDALSSVATVHDASNAVVVRSTGGLGASDEIRVSCWDASTGMLRWDHDGVAVDSKVMSARKAEHVALRVKNELHFLNAKTGRLVRRRKYSSKSRRPQVLAPDGSIGFTATKTGRLLILPAWSAKIPEPPEEPDAPAEEETPGGSDTSR